MAMPRFTYLIAPENRRENPLTIALTITGNAVTIYAQENQTFSQRRSRKLTSRLRNFYRYITNHVFQFNAQGRASGDAVHLVYENNRGHHALHSNNTEEFDIEHGHLQYNKEIRLKNLKKLLKHLAKSDKTLGLSHKIIKDILYKYKTCYRNNFRSPTNIASNSNFYNNHHRDDGADFPTIDQHAQCLDIPHSLGCTPDNPYSPPPAPLYCPAPLAGIQPPSGLKHSGVDSDNVGLVAGAAVALTLFAGLFCWRRANNRFEKVAAPEIKSTLQKQA